MAGTLRVDESLVAAEAATTTTDVPAYAVVTSAGGETARFVAGQLLVHSADVERVRALTADLPGAQLRPLEDFTPPPGVTVSTDPVRSSPPDVAVLSFDAEESLAGLEGDGAVIPQASADGTVDSYAALGTLVRAAELQGEGLRVGVDWAGDALALPATSASELGGGDPYQWPEFQAPTDFVRAWRLLAARRLLGGALDPVRVAVIDSGFWFDRTTGGCLGSPPEFPGLVQQLDVVNGEPRAGGTAIIPGATWHGQGVAGVLLAPHDDRAGTGGAAGNLPGVVTPFLFRTSAHHSKTMSALRTATMWGCDVANISYGTKPATFLGMDTFPDDAWNEVFRWAARAGLFTVCAAGNDAVDLITTNPRPATRTEGVMTIGATSAAAADRPWWSGPGSGSNWGSSVDLWAPGEDLHAGPRPGAPNGSLVSGTSGAAPLVAAAAALVKTVDPLISSPALWQLLTSTATPTPAADSRVGARLDAGAAVWRAMGERFPQDVAEPDDVPGQARPLQRDPLGRLLPSPPLRAVSTPAAQDWHAFSLGVPSRVVVTLDFAAGLDPAGPPSLRLLPVEEDAELEGFRTVWGPTRHEVTVDVAPTGDYRVVVSGARTVYELAVTVTAVPLPPDRFEPNDSLETAAPITMGWVDPDPIVVAAPLFATPAGSIEGLTLSAGDEDWFAVHGVPPHQGHRIPWVFARGLDVPVTVEVLDADGRVLRRDVGHPQASAQLELPHPFGYVRVRADRPTRWNVWFVSMVDLTKIPELVEVAPDPPG